MKKNSIYIAVYIIIGAVCFYAGTLYGQNTGKSAASNNQQVGSQTGQQFGMRTGVSAAGQRGARGNGGGFVMGEVLSKDDTSITVKVRDGGSKIVFYSDSTEVSKFVEGALSDLEVGKTVSINGKSNQDGSVTAQTIQLRPTGQQTGTTQGKPDQGKRKNAPIEKNNGVQK